MTRIFCWKHKKMSNAYPKRDKKNFDKILYYLASCGCKFKPNQIADIEVHHQTRYFLKDGTELIRPNIPKEWSIKKNK